MAAILITCIQMTFSARWHLLPSTGCDPVWRAKPFKDHWFTWQNWITQHVLNSHPQKSSTVLFTLAKPYLDRHWICMAKQGKSLSSSNFRIYSEHSHFSCLTWWFLGDFHSHRFFQRIPGNWEFFFFLRKHCFTIVYPTCFCVFLPSKLPNPY